MPMRCWNTIKRWWNLSTKNKSIVKRSLMTYRKRNLNRVWNSIKNCREFCWTQRNSTSISVIEIKNSWSLVLNVKVLSKYLSLRGLHGRLIKTSLWICNKLRTMLRPRTVSLTRSFGSNAWGFRIWRAHWIERGNLWGRMKLNMQESLALSKENWDKKGNFCRMSKIRPQRWRQR